MYNCTYVCYYWFFMVYVCAKSDKVHAVENAQGPKNWFDIRKWSLGQPTNESVHPYGPLSLVVLWDTNGGREAPK